VKTFFKKNIISIFFAIIYIYPNVATSAYAQNPIKSDSEIDKFKLTLPFERGFLKEVFNIDYPLKGGGLYSGNRCYF